MAKPDDPDSLPTQQWANSPDAGAGLGSAPTPQPTPPTDSAFAGMLGAKPAHSQAGWHPPTLEELQARLPQYEIRELLGRGGMGAVYKGWQRSLERLVAIKILPPELVSGEVDFAARFKREAKAMARLKHPGIIPVHDAGETADGLLYFVMDFIEGTDLQRMIAARGRLPPEEAVPIIARVLDALAYAHKHGIIHRDIKPANIMVDDEGNVLVADFGLARSTSAETTMLTLSNVAMGTPDFMAPESHLGMDQVDHRADLYAVGVMLYQMLTGKLPRGRFDPPSRAVPGLDKRLDRIVDRTLQNSRDARYSSAIELRADLEPVVTRIMARRPSATDKTRSSGRKALAGAAVLAALAAGTFLFFKKPQAASEAEAKKPVSVAAALTQLPASIEARAIKLWDTHAKVKGDTKGVVWEKEAMRLDGRGMSVPKLAVRDIILRASILANQDANRPILQLRNPPGVAAGDVAYGLTIDASKGLVVLGSHNRKRGGTLGAWQFPRVYGPDEWLKLEFRAIGDALTVIADGRVLGSVRDSTLSEPGGFELYAESKGYFRDVSYIPLGKR